METQVAVLLGLGIPLGMAAIATKASRVWRLFATKTRPEVASAYAWAYSICTVAFVVLLGGVAAISGTKPASVALLLGYEALLIAENALSRSAVVSSKSFRVTVFLVVAALYWSVSTRGSRLLIAAVCPLLVFHGVYDLFVVDLT